MAQLRADCQARGRGGGPRSAANPPDARACPAPAIGGCVPREWEMGRDTTWRCPRPRAELLPGEKFKPLRCLGRAECFGSFIPGPRLFDIRHRPEHVELCKHYGIVGCS